MDGGGDKQTESIAEQIIYAIQFMEADGSEMSLSPRSSVALISIISLISCMVDMKTIVTSTCDHQETRERIDSMRELLLALFQMANLLLLLASIMENSWLVQVYVWYTLAFVIMGLLLAMTDFMFRVQTVGTMSACLIFLPEVAFLFVLSRCLPLVDKYGRDLEGHSSISA